MGIFQKFSRGSSTDNGVVYVAYGENFLKEMMFSIESFKKYNPKIPVTVFVDQEIESPLIERVHIIEAKHKRPKIDFLIETPYERTLFLDTDTIVNHSLEDMFEILDNFDFVAAHDLARKRKKYSAAIPEYKKIPYAFSEVNTGVMAFRKNEHTMRLLTLWKENFYKYYKKCPWDQPSFRISLWQACMEGLRMYIFPVEYNLRSKANREKNRQLHDQFGEDHLKPRIYHIHADSRINQGTYEVKTMEEALKACEENYLEF